MRSVIAQVRCVLHSDICVQCRRDEERNGNVMTQTVAECVIDGVRCRSGESAIQKMRGRKDSCANVPGYNVSTDMPDSDLIQRYNYDSFVREKFGQWMRFAESPPLGTPAPDHNLWRLDETETSFREMWIQFDFLVVEFGSLT